MSPQSNQDAIPSYEISMIQHNVGEVGIWTGQRYARDGLSLHIEMRRSGYGQGVYFSVGRMAKVISEKKGTVSEAVQRINEIARGWK